jgi:hypothetical protein
MNKIARYSNRRTISACRAYLPPARSASTNRSREAASARSGARHLAITTAMPTKDAAFSAEHPTRAGGRDDDTADRRSDRPGQVHVDAVQRSRLRQHRTVHQVRLDRLPGRAGDCVSAAEKEGQREDDRRGSRAEERRDGQCPGGEEHRKLGTEQQSPAVDQVCPGTCRQSEQDDRQTRSGRTSDTSNGELSTSSHCAPTVCIQVPTFEANCAIHSARKIGWSRKGTKADGGPAGREGSGFAPPGRRSAGIPARSGSHAALPMAHPPTASRATIRHHLVDLGDVARLEDPSQAGAIRW